jgi:hypothetical protein
VSPVYKNLCPDFWRRRFASKSAQERIKKQYSPEFLPSRNAARNLPPSREKWEITPTAKILTRSPGARNAPYNKKGAKLFRAFQIPLMRWC